jgi:hypothetical protein
MTTIEKLYSNLNDLSKPKSIIDTPSSYNKSEENFKITSALEQGNKFKKYQNKIKNKNNNIQNSNIQNNNIENSNIQNSNIQNSNIQNNLDNKKESFENYFDNLQISKNGLTAQSREIINNSDFSSDIENIENLKEEYNTTIQEYEDLLNKIAGRKSSYFDRINPNNRFLNNTVRFTTGHICYVTNKGVVKWIPSMRIWNSVNAPRRYIQLDIPWISSYNTPGTEIPTDPPLISGTNVELGQSLGFEGSNIFVNNLVNNPNSRYIGCFNDRPPAREIQFVPVMNSTNNVSGFRSSASTVYRNNNTWGPWAAFDRNRNTFWHSVHNSYNSRTGAYRGNISTSVNTRNSGNQNIRGEFLQINLPQNYSLSRYEIQGRQDCCGNPTGRTPNTWIIAGWNGSQWIEVDRRENEAVNYDLRTFNIATSPEYSAYRFITTVCGNERNTTNQRTCVQLSQWNLFTSSNRDNSERAMIWNPNVIGYTDYQTCQRYAINNGFQYFGMQDTRDDGSSACVVSNNLAIAQMYGPGIIFAPQLLWSSNTTGQTGASAILTTTGSLSVINSESGSIFSTDNSSAQPGNYLGCYGDSRTRAMTLIDRGRQRYNLETCQAEAKNRNQSFFGLQNSTSGNNAQCSVSNSLSGSIRFGRANNCTRLSNGTWSGGGWSNAVYNTKEPDSNYYLILQDDGNMCIYRGTGPNDNQGNIWCSNTNNRRRNPNINFTAENSKYGRNWMASGSTLAANEFIGSNDGSMYLIMQSDGNLVLNTSQERTGCSRGRNNMMVGSSMINTLYEVSPNGFRENLGKLAYVNQNSEINDYSSDNIELTNNYRVINSTNTPGNDIQNSIVSNSTVQNCQNTCNNLRQCYGFVFDNNNNICYPKNSSINKNSNPNQSTDIYIRGKRPINTPSGISNRVNNIDSVRFQNYITSNNNNNGLFNLSTATDAQEKQLNVLQEKMNELANKITNWTNKFGSNTFSAQNQTEKNNNGLDGYLREIKKNNEEISSSHNNINNIVNDSDIIILQKNYNYLFWSILATGTVLVTINISNK